MKGGLPHPCYPVQPLQTKNPHSSSYSQPSTSQCCWSPATAELSGFSPRKRGNKTQTSAGTLLVEHPFVPLNCWAAGCPPLRTARLSSTRSCRDFQFHQPENLSGQPSHLSFPWVGRGGWRPHSVPARQRTSYCHRFNTHFFSGILCVLQRESHPARKAFITRTNSSPSCTQAA